MVPELSPEEERLLIRDISVAAEADSKEGDTFFLITQRWWQNWLDYVNQEVPVASANGSHENAASSSNRRPQAIDNTDLINDATSEEVSNVEMELHDTLVEGRDYILLPQPVWEKLHGWYGGGPILPRKAINNGLSQTDLAIEVYPLRLQLILIQQGERAIVRISKKDTVGDLHRKACDVFELALDQVCIWDYFGQQKHTLMDNMDKTLDDANIQMDQDILVEIISDSMDGSLQENGYAERDSSSMLIDASGTTENTSNYYTSPSSELDNNNTATTATTATANNNSMYATNHIATRGVGAGPVGLTGLLNLGNTCFMNSAIQCLVHTPEFARYFREDYHREINWQNPLGMVGELALAFGELLRKLWAPGRTPVSPRPFKTKLSRFAPQFSGYSQHDSQELLAFLLDGLHEDLNRVKHRPYIKTRDADGRPDEEVADEYWANHIARNNSIIVDVCQGQFKSTLVCPVCEKVSVTFDPFMYLSLPLQSASSRSMTVLVFSGISPPSPVTVSVPKQGRCRDLIQALSNSCSVKSGERILLAEVRGHSVYQFLEDPVLLLSTIKDDDHLVAYRVPKLEKGATTYVQFIHRREEPELANSSSSTTWKPFGVPLVYQISRNSTKIFDLYQIVNVMLSPMKLNQGLNYTSTSNYETSCGMKLQLLEKGNSCLDLLEEEGEKAVTIPANLISAIVFVNWSMMDLKRYDITSMENIPEVVKYAPPLKRTRGEPLSLYACLDAFLREEPLVPEDMWYCPRCKEQRQASKKLDLWRLPDVLVIHLKRFSFSRSTKHKLETYVDFPVHNLDLTNYVANKRSPHCKIYELYALSNHYGSMASGHYTAHIKLLDENRWYTFDDTHVTPINEDEVKSAAAYVLFYRRVQGEDTSISNGTHRFHNSSHHR
ncbi:hypothetical protein LUZ61_005280 [Rhynchospora tenuis]|uniref:Ubiquitin carboxyl-terminal hydrolase n=1 Tax=Rhynchospora tenuis TaxID=198213 RepID=A0AAD6EUL2_9POAL|nr:hypothetical protein LUZ61_005280 [Rhynchospora tenuis]